VITRLYALPNKLCRLIRALCCHQEAIDEAEFYVMSKERRYMTRGRPSLESMNRTFERKEEEFVLENDEA